MDKKQKSIYSDATKFGFKFQNMWCANLHVIFDHFDGEIPNKHNSFPVIWFESNEAPTKETVIDEFSKMIDAANIELNPETPDDAPTEFVIKKRKMPNYEIIGVTLTKVVTVKPWKHQHEIPSAPIPVDEPKQTPLDELPPTLKDGEHDEQIPI